MFRCNNVHKENGATLIEFAVAIPVFLVLMVGILFYGIAFVTQQAVNFAAERGAAAAVVVSPDAPDFNARVAQLVSPRVREALSYLPGGSDVPNADAAVSVNNVDACPGGNGGKAVKICVISPDPATGSRQIQVRLSPSFQQLWGFPQTGLLPTPDVVQATGSAVIAEPGG